MITQTETIVWHRYPDKKPKKDNYYYVQFGTQKERFFGKRLVLWKNGKWLKFWEDNDAVVDALIYAWTEEPKGWVK